MFVKLGDRLYNKSLIASLKPLPKGHLYTDDGKYFGILTMAAFTTTAGETPVPEQELLTREEYFYVWEQMMQGSA